MNTLEMIMKRLDLLEGAFFRLCAVQASQGLQVDAVAQEYGSAIHTLHEEFVAAQEKPAIILPPH